MRSNTIADINRAISSLMDLRAEVEAMPKECVTSIFVQCESGLAAQDVFWRAAEIATDLIVHVGESAAFLGESSFDSKGVREAFKDVLSDELHDAKEWCERYGQEEAA